MYDNESLDDPEECTSVAVIAGTAEVEEVAPVDVLQVMTNASARANNDPASMVILPRGLDTLVLLVLGRCSFQSAT